MLQHYEGAVCKHPRTHEESYPNLDYDLKYSYIQFRNVELNIVTDQIDIDWSEQPGCDFYSFYDVKMADDEEKIFAVIFIASYHSQGEPPCFYYKLTEHGKIIPWFTDWAYQSKGNYICAPLGMEIHSVDSNSGKYDVFNITSIAEKGKFIDRFVCFKTDQAILEKISSTSFVLVSPITKKMEWIVLSRQGLIRHFTRTDISSLFPVDEVLTRSYHYFHQVTANQCIAFSRNNTTSQHFLNFIECKQDSILVTKKIPIDKELSSPLVLIKNGECVFQVFNGKLWKAFQVGENDEIISIESPLDSEKQKNTTKKASPNVILLGSLHVLPSASEVAYSNKLLSCTLLSHLPRVLFDIVNEYLQFDCELLFYDNSSKE